MGSDIDTKVIDTSPRYRGIFNTIDTRVYLRYFDTAHEWDFVSQNCLMLIWSLWLILLASTHP